MKKNNLTKYAFLPLLAIALGFLQGCKEDIDMSDRTFVFLLIAIFRFSLFIRCPPVRAGGP